MCMMLLELSLLGRKFKEKRKVQWQLVDVPLKQESICYAKLPCRQKSTNQADDACMGNKKWEQLSVERLAGRDNQIYR